jgi:hypothetical protein
MKGFQTYKDYVYIDLHFKDNTFIWNENYNYSKITENAFLKRKDLVFFRKFEDYYKGDRRSIIDHLISGFIFDYDIWIGNILNDEVICLHESRMKRFNSLESTFSHEANKIEFYLFSNSITFEKSLLTKGTKDPIILELFMNDVSLETFSVLEELHGFTKLWFPLNPLQKLRKMLIYKYSKLLRLNERNMSKINNVYQQLKTK